MADPPLIPVFMPPLVTLLVQRERTKGSPLTEEEVLAVRNKGICMMMQADRARMLAEKRGYDDIDPDNCWHEWQRVREELNTAAEGSGDAS